jgi:hypothetical protein
MTASIWDPTRNIFVTDGQELLEDLGLEYTITTFGGDPTKSDADNKIALQAMITALDSVGGGVGYVPYNISYGYKATDLTTFPQFTGITKPIIIRDYSAGDEFSGYPSSYEGAQERRFFYTPQPFAAGNWTGNLLAGATSATLTSNWLSLTGPWSVTFSNGEQRMVTFTNGATTATWTGGLASAATSVFTYVNYGQHNGNYFILRGDWPPGFQVFNDANYGAPGSAGRSALDNRRAHFAVGYKGRATWQVGQGVKIGPNFTDEEMSDFIIEKLPQAGDTLGLHGVLICERKTCNQSYGGGRTVPNAAHHFERGASVTNPLMMFEDTASTVTLRLRISGSSAGDMDLQNISGNVVFTVPSVGNALTIRRDTRNVLIGTDTDSAAAILNVASVTKGFLPPRMTTTQRDAIASPPVGLLIFNTTTNKLNVRGASAWEAVTSV